VLRFKAHTGGGLDFAKQAVAKAKSKQMPFLSNQILNRGYFFGLCRTMFSNACFADSPG
jgi:hypothetical protein